MKPFLCLAFIITFISGRPQDKKIVVIDPGHGGIDSGAVGVNGLKEKDVVLEIAKAIQLANVENQRSNLEIYLTRSSDTLISLSDRTAVTKLLGASLFISLHCNYSVNPYARGIEVYVYGVQSEFSSRSIWLGYKIQKWLNDTLGLKSRGVKFANFKVLRDLRDTCPAVLVELGFLSNGDEGGYLLNLTSYWILADVILKSLIKNFINYEGVGGCNF